MTYSAMKKIKIFYGNVILIRDELTIQADKVILTTNPIGYEFAVFYAAPRQLVSFRQKKNKNQNIIIKGQAKRVEYNQTTQILTLFSKARIQFIDNNKITSEINGELISYNHRTQFYSINNSYIYQNKPKYNNKNITTIIQENLD